MCWIRHRLRSLFFIRLFYSREQKGVTAFIFGGSVAKGMERADSDLDGMAAVSQREFKYREQHNELTEVIQGKLVEKCRAFCESMDNGLLEDIINSYHAWTKWKHNSDISVVSGRYQLDFEKWWYIPRPLVGEW